MLPKDIGGTPVAATLPYIQAYGNITRALDKIQTASTPDRFTQDFLSTKLSLTGGGARPVIPFLKRTGFLASDGTPTDIYNRFRNAAQRGAAAAEAIRVGYAPLYEVNEYAHDLTDKDLRGAIVQVTGGEPGSSTVGATVGSFKALRAYADFDAPPADASVDERTEGIPVAAARSDGGSAAGLRLGYTINLNLPATSDIAVFNAIFKSLREHLLS
jgi:hypothetical protein